MSAAAWRVTCVLFVAMAAAGCAAPPRSVRSPSTAEAITARPGPDDGEDGPPGSSSDRPPPELAELHVACAPGAPCPESIGMLVGPAGQLGPDGRPNRCTGALVGPDRLLTASHCLPATTRRAGGSCRGVWVAFPSTDRHPMEWAACDRVIDARAVDDRDVLRPDWAVVRLERPVGRQRLAVLTDEPAPRSIVQVVAVDPHPIYGTQHALETRLCRVRSAEEARILFGPDAARVGWLSDCPTLPGNSGAPILDREGRVRGIVHGGSDPAQGIGVTSRPPPI